MSGWKINVPFDSAHIRWVRSRVPGFNANTYIEVCVEGQWWQSRDYQILSLSVLGSSITIELGSYCKIAAPTLDEHGEPITDTTPGPFNIFDHLRF